MVIIKRMKTFPLKQYVNFHCLSFTLGVFDIPVQRVASLLVSGTDRKQQFSILNPLVKVLIARTFDQWLLQKGSELWGVTTDAHNGENGLKQRAENRLRTVYSQTRSGVPLRFPNFSCH